MRFELAGPADDAELRRLLRENPFEGAVRISFEREPSAFLAATLQGDMHQIIVARDETTGKLLGSGSRAIADAWVNGRPARLGYLGQLRVDRAHRGNARMVQRGYAFLRELHGDGATPFYVTTIIEDNLTARRFLEAGIEGLPRYRPMEAYVTLTIPVRRRRATPGIEIASAGPGDLELIADLLARWCQRHQFAAVWSRESLLRRERMRELDLRHFLVARRDGRLAGCAAIWDQRAFKQAVVRGYDAKLALVRPLLNFASPVLRIPRLPPSGTTLRAAVLSHVGVLDDDPEVAVSLVAEASSRAVAKNLDYLHVGFAARHPLLTAIERKFSHRRYASVLYVVHWEDGAQAADALDARIPHLEAAVL